MPELHELDPVMGFLAAAFRRADAVEGDTDASAQARRFVSGNDRLTPAEQVDIYRRQYWLRHVDSLLEDYPGLVHLMGDDEFETFAHVYLEKHPPAHPSLRDLGHAVLAFAERFQGFPAGLRDACLDMVRYEHAFVDLFDGPDAGPLDAQKVGALPEAAWETARIVLHPLLVRLRLDHPVHRVRLALKAGEAPPRLERTATRLVLYRRDNLVHTAELEAVPFELLGRLARGEPLVGACSAMAERLDEPARAALEADVGVWFQSWTSLRWIVDVDGAPGASHR